MAIDIPEQYQSLKTKLETIVKKTIIQYELTSSDYNPTINSTIIITCTCKNVLGNPISNKTLELFQNGTSVGTATTNANGVATFSYTFSNWDWHHFSCNGATLDLQATGMKQVKQSTNWTVLTYTLFVDESNRTAMLSFHSTSSMSMGTGTENYVINGFIPTKYRPKNNINVLIGRYSDILMWVWTNGSIGLSNLKGSTLQNYGTDGVAVWNF